MRELFKTISPSEWKFLYILMVVMVLLTGAPYLVGYLLTPAGTFYSGVHALNPGDIFVYYSYIDQVRHGDIFVKNLLTPEAQSLGTFNVWWVVVAFFAEIFRLPTILAFQITRLLMVPVFVLVAYLFLSYIFNAKSKRKLALVFVLFSSGIGAYFGGPIISMNIPFDPVDTYKWPIDLWLTEANSFLVLYQTSHFIASIALTLLIFLFFLLSFEKNKISYAIGAGLLTLFYLNFHPYYLPTIFGTMGLYLFLLMVKEGKFLWEKSWYLILAFLISLPSLIYHVWLIKSDPVIGARAIQNVTDISPLPYILLGYGFLLVGFVLGIRHLIKNKKWNIKHTFLMCWLAINVFLIFSSFPFHSRYTQGLQFTLVIFMVVGIFHLRDWLKIKLRPKTYDYFVNNPAFLILLFLIMFSFSTLFNITRDIYFFVTKPSALVDIFYIPQDMFVATNYLREKDRVIILGDPVSSEIMAAFSGQHVYSGHGHETLYYHSQRKIFVGWFYEFNDKDERKKQFLAKNNIDYVLYSGYEKKLGQFDPATKDYLLLELDLPQAQLYRVVTPD